RTGDIVSSESAQTDFSGKGPLKETPAPGGTLRTRERLRNYRGGSRVSAWLIIRSASNGHNRGRRPQNRASGRHTPGMTSSQHRSAPLPATYQTNVPGTNGRESI